MLTLFLLMINTSKTMIYHNNSSSLSYDQIYIVLSLLSIPITSFPDTNTHTYTSDYHSVARNVHDELLYIK